MRFRPLKTGTLIEIYRGNRGHVYMVAGYDRRNSQLRLIKNTCVNNDGSIHASTVDYHKTIRVHAGVIEGQQFLNAPAIKRVIGERCLDREQAVKVGSFVRNRLGDRNTKFLKENQAIYPPIMCLDGRISSKY